MKQKWNDLMELDFSKLLEGKEYDAAGEAVFKLARQAYFAGYQRAMQAQAANIGLTVVPDRKDG